MTPEFGDVVTITGRRDGVRWVMSPSGSPSPDSTPYVRLLRPDQNGNWESFTCKAIGLTVLERPTFEIGEKITVGDRTGTILKIDGDTARIRWDRRSIPLKGGGALADYGTEGNTPLWRLSLDNQLAQGEQV